MINLAPKPLCEYLYTLAEDVTEQRVSEQFTSLTFLSEPIKFSEAPEDELLMILGDHLTGCVDMDLGSHNFGLLKGSLISKMSREIRDALEIDESYRLKKFESLLTVDRAYVRVRAPKSVSKIVTVTSRLYRYGTDVSNVFVIPINQVLSDGKPLFEYYAFYSNKEMQLMDSV